MSQQARVLIVDDDADLVASLRVALAAAGFGVLEAPDATSGLAALARERPDVVLLDVMMPGGTEGFHFVWEVRRRSEPYFQRVPILVVTSIHDKTALRFYPDTGDGTYEPGEYLPVQDFLDKPVEPELLVSRILRALAVAARP